MKKLLDSDKLSKYEREFHWAARILAIIYIIALGIYAFTSAKSSLEFWMFIVPSFLVLVALIASWRHELLGIVLFTILTLASIGFFSTYKSLPGLLFITFPLFVISILFIIDFHAKKKWKHHI